MPTNSSRVPSLSMPVTSEEYGGAYYDTREREFIATAGTTSSHLALVDDSGGERYSCTLSFAAASALLDHFAQAAENLLPALYVCPGLRVVPTWSFGDDYNNVLLTGARLGEFAAWLEYATGRDTWDGGDSWEY